jgi:dihydrofolate reductase
MGKLVVTEFITLDGVVEAPGGEEDFIHAGWTSRIELGADGVAFKLEETRHSDALVFGRVTYDGMAAVWPHETGEVADRFNTLPKFVISDTVSDPAWNNTEVLGGDLRANVEKLKERFAGEIVVHGSTRVVRQLLELDLIDELRLMLFPIVLGSGERLFAHADAAKRFRLTSTTPVGDGIAVLVYRPVHDHLVVRDLPEPAAPGSSIVA